MNHSAFLVVPTGDPTNEEGWEQLDRDARMARLRSEMAELGERIRARLPGLELEYMEGAGAWTVRSATPKTREELLDKLAGLPVDVAPDDRFYAL